jgi:hypothetical protein
MEKTTTKIIIKTPNASLELQVNQIFHHTPSLFFPKTLIPSSSSQLTQYHRSQRHANCKRGRWTPYKKDMRSLDVGEKCHRGKWTACGRYKWLDFFVAAFARIELLSKISLYTHTQASFYCPKIIYGGTKSSFQLHCTYFDIFDKLIFKNALCHNIRTGPGYWGQCGTFVGGKSLCFTVLQYVSLCFSVLIYGLLHCASMRFTVHHSASLFTTVLHCSPQFFTVHHSDFQCHTVLLCATLCHTVPHCATLCHTVLLLLPCATVFYLEWPGHCASTVKSPKMCVNFCDTIQNNCKYAGRIYRPKN